MTPQYHLSLVEAIFVNINVMIGMGLFVNTAQLVKQVGVFSFANYLLVGALLLPLILSMTKLVFFHPQGGFYTYAAKELNESCGFLSAWSYFVGKTASATLILYAVTLIIREMISSLVQVNPIPFFILCLSIVLIVNTYGMRFGSLVQKIIVCAKFVPILIVIGVGIWFMFVQNVPAMHFNFHALIITIPIVLYATIGFETACVLSLAIKDAQKNAPIAIFSSYLIVITIAAIYQFFASVALMNYLPQLHEYQDAFRQIAGFFKTISFEHEIWTLLYGGIAISGIGSAFGIFYSNMWNLYTIAKHDHLFFNEQFTKLSARGIPFVCLIAEGIIALILIIISQASIVLLQQCSALAISLTFTMSVIALLRIYKKQNKNMLLPIFGLINCCIFILSCVYSLIKTNSYGFILFACILLLGIGMLLISKRNKR